MDVLPLSYRGKSGAWFYARLLKPDADPTDPEQILKDQFLHFHGGKRIWQRESLSLTRPRLITLPLNTYLLMCGAVSSIIREARMVE